MVLVGQQTRGDQLPISETFIHLLLQLFLIPSVQIRQPCYYQSTYIYFCLDQDSLSIFSDTNIKFLFSEKCRKMEILSPNITLFPDQEYYGPGEEVTIGCPGGYEPNVRLIQCVKETNRNRWNVGHVFCSQTNFTMGPSYGMNQTEIQPWDLFVGPTFGLVIPISLKLLGLLSVLLWKGISTLSKKYWDSRQATADLHVTSGHEEHTVYHQDNTLDNKKIFSKKEEKEQLYANLDHYTCVK
ncbi:uncharacterized protein LOC121396151 [Xenopus laevis]|uniref:Uncharacterized protein LOC121396151 n=1 Tax=Xenopus laevis TaxID=8355 RepID=A0A8J1LCG2_XENLA|nr:uncharacterized protein LOC121396151 [Xenopus laevis]